MKQSTLSMALGLTDILDFTYSTVFIIFIPTEDTWLINGKYFSIFRLFSFPVAIMKCAHIILLFLVTFCLLPGCFGGVIRDFLQNNIAGPPVNFEQQSWPIDPEAGIRRRKDYIEANGLYGYKHVERIGLGEDGRTEERRIQQRIRDSVGALSYQI